MTEPMSPAQFDEYLESLSLPVDHIPGGAAPDAQDAAQWPDPPDKAAYHGLTGRIVQAIEPHTEADPVAILIQTLAAFGNVVGRNPFFEVEAVQHYANLYVVLVGATAKGRKGTSWGHVMRLFRSVDSTWTADCVLSGLSSGEGLIWAIRNAIEKQEPIKEKGRVTDYQTVIVDPGVDDKRLLAIEPEFARTLRVATRDGNTLSACIREGWDSGNLRSVTKSSPARVTGGHISIIGHITQEELLRSLDSTEAANGFANRFLWVAVQRSKCLPEGGRLKAVNLSGLVKGMTNAVDFARRAGRIPLDHEAREVWRAVYPALSDGASGLFGSVTSRAEAQSVRLALLYALLDCSSEIRKVHLMAALAVWDFCEQSARWIFGDATGDPVADEILAALRRNGDTGLTRTQISSLFQRNKNAGQIGRALSSLLQRGRIRAVVGESDGSGRPAERWIAIGSSFV